MANIITGIRILCGIALLLPPVFSPAFYALYIAAGVSDMIDGTVARKTGTVSEFGSKLDTAERSSARWRRLPRYRKGIPLGQKMEISFRKANIEDAELLIELYNASFYNDFIRYGECPGYGKTKEMMGESIRKYPKHVILCDHKPVGCVSMKPLEHGVYEIGCLCVVPEFQRKGIGTQAIQFIKTAYEDWERLTLVTPVDKRENVTFYAEKCSFTLVSTEKDGNVELGRFVLER